MTISPQEPVSEAEFLNLPETKPASEWIDGYIYQKPMPQGKHARLQLKLCNAINQITEDRHLALAFPELSCSFGGRIIVPDISVFTWDQIPFNTEGEVENGFETYPAWVIEILSPEQNATKVISNILHCLTYGTQLGWLVDPSERLILVFLPGKQPLEMSADERLPVPDFLELELDLTVAQTFEWLKAVKSGNRAS